jgi:putative hydrolase of the HAD superfamily
MKPAEGRHHLLIDADDTLWENNIYFEDAFEQFVDFLDHSSMSSVEIRTVLDEIEIANIKLHGYGAENFARNLAQCYERLAEREIREVDRRTVMSYAKRILDCPMQLIEGVSETLTYLAARHELTLFTKGHPEEQRLKIDRSGLGELFHHTAIVKEKDTQAYAMLARERGLNTERTWMVGNSPKSDINPALAAGLRAVYIPHPRTWGLEHEEIQPVDGRLLVLEHFADLQMHF